MSNAIAIRDDRPPSPKDIVAYAIRTWNGMSPSRKRMQREACERYGHRWTTSDFSERMQVCLACCAYQEIPDEQPVPVPVPVARRSSAWSADARSDQTSRAD